MIPFTPSDVTKQMAVTSTSGSIAVAGGSQVMIQNSGSKHAYVKCGAGATTAVAPAGSPVTSSYPVLAGFGYQVTVPQSADTLAAVCAAGETTTLHVTAGYGA